MWAESYRGELSGLLLLQQELAENVAREVHSASLPPKNSGLMGSPVAHDAYLRGRYNWFALNYETARVSFEKAIQIQPDYVLAYSRHAHHYAARSVGRL